MHRPDEGAPAPHTPPRHASGKPPAPPPPPPPRRAMGGSFLSRPYEKLSHPTYRVRFRRGWFGRLVVQVEWVVQVFESHYPSASIKFERTEWRDAAGAVRDEVGRGYFSPELHQSGAKKIKRYSRPHPR